LKISGLGFRQHLLTKHPAADLNGRTERVDKR
jgi:hypothetical protein